MNLYNPFYATFSYPLLLGRAIYETYETIYEIQSFVAVNNM
jgi:hypothetical protein